MIRDDVVHVLTLPDFLIPSGWEDSLDFRDILVANMLGRVLLYLCELSSHGFSWGVCMMVHWYLDMTCSITF